MNAMRWTKLSLLFAVGASGMALAEPARYELDPAHTTVAFLVEHIGYAKTLGQFLRATGGYTFDGESGTLSSLRVVVATDSVDTHHEARDRHLTSDDFLDSGTIVTADGSLSAHFEQTVAITENGPEALTGMLHTGLERGAVV